MRSTLICTVGTSLIYPNLKNLPSAANYEAWLSRQPEQDHAHFTPDAIAALKTAFDQQNWSDLAIHLSQLAPTARLCGAEINSITDLLQREYCAPNSRVIFCHSDTPDGNAIATILRHYYSLQGHETKCINIADLQDKAPKRFRTKGLRNLVKAISTKLRAYGAENCALNATGGYKAQIAIAVLRE